MISPSDGSCMPHLGKTDSLVLLYWKASSEWTSEAARVVINHHREEGLCGYGIGWTQLAVDHKLVPFVHCFSPFMHCCGTTLIWDQSLRIEVLRIPRLHW